MKVNLLINSPDDVRSGYLNIDPSGPDPAVSGYVKGDISDLSHSVEGGECHELVAHDVLDAFHGTFVDQVLDNWLSKLGHRARLCLSVVDLREVCRAYMAGRLSLDETNILLHGNSYSRKCSLTLAQLAEVLTNKGLVILTRRIENYRAVVVAERP